MNEKFYEQLIRESPLGYAYYKIICDEEGNPQDYEFLHINKAFERLTGLKKEEVLNKTVLTIMPDIRNDEFDWISFYGNIALKGEDKEFEYYSHELNRYYAVKVYSPEKYYFVTIFNDITIQVQSANISEKIIEYCENDVDYQRMTEDILLISGAKYAAFNLFDDNGRDFTTVGVAGIKDHIKKAMDILGFDIIGKRWKYDPIKERKIKSQIVTSFNSFNELVGNVISKDIASLIEMVFEIDKVIVVRIIKDSHIIGDFTLFMPKDDRSDIYGTLEIFASQIGLFIEKRKAEEKLKESENYLNLFFKQSLMGIFFMMLDEPIEWNENVDKEKVMDYVFEHQRITKVNQAMLNQYGISEEDFLYKTPNQLFSHDLEQGKKVWIEFFDKGQLHIDTNEQRADGTQMWIEGDYICLYDSEGRIKGHFGIQQDVSERREGQHQLAERDRLLTKLSQQVPGTIYQYQYYPDGRTCFPFASEGIWDIYRVTPEEVKYDASIVYSRIHPEDYDRVEESITYSYENLSIWEDEYRVILPDKGIIWVRGLARPEKLKDGSVLWHGYISDASEIKEAEKSIFIEKEQFKTTLLSVGDGVISTDAQGNVLILNKIAEELTGWTQAEALGKPLEEVFNIVNEFTRERCEDLVYDVLKTGDIIELANHTILISKDGNEIPIEDSVAPIKDDQGNINGMVLVFKDFTEKKEKQDEIIYLSFHDQLTNLYNRRFFEEELRRLDIEKNLPLTMVILDVNGLKLINDAFGHMMGDEVLKKVAKVMKNQCRVDDIIARIGGDEFVILLPKTNGGQAQNIMSRVCDAIGKEKVGSINLSISFGHATKREIKQDISTIFKKAEDHMYRRKLYESSSLRYKTVTVIMKTLYEKNEREEKHSKSVSKLCMKIGTILNLNQEQIDELEMVGLMHDIGKIAIDEHILNKPSALTDSEWMEIKRHPEIGYNILRTVNEYAPFAEYVLAHHERWDGRGYPKGLKGKEIPLQARIIAVADAYDAMVGYRTYKDPLTEDEAIHELIENAGTQFDPDIVRVFVETMKIVP